jgi:hypothetical protein
MEFENRLECCPSSTRNSSIENDRSCLCLTNFSRKSTSRNSWNVAGLKHGVICSASMKLRTARGVPPKNSPETTTLVSMTTRIVSYVTNSIFNISFGKFGTFCRCLEFIHHFSQRQRGFCDAFERKHISTARNIYFCLFPRLLQFFWQFDCPIFYFECSSHVFIVA